MLTSVEEGGRRVGRFGGVEVRLDFTVAVVAFGLLVQTWRGVIHKGHGPGYALAASAIVIAMYLGALALHEVAHLAVARGTIRPTSVKLWGLGDVARPGAGPEGPSAGSEAAVAAIGIVASAALGFALVLVARSLPAGHVHHALEVWGRVNLLLAAVNAVPGCGLDGGGLVRALLRRITGDRARASRIALRVGQVFSVLLAVAAFLPHATLDLLPPIILAAVSLVAIAEAGAAPRSTDADNQPDADRAGSSGEPSDPPETA